MRDRLRITVRSVLIRAALLLALAAAAAPARVCLSIACAPGANLERFGTASGSIDMAAYVHTDMLVIDAPAAASARVVHMLLYRQGEHFPPRGAVAAALGSPGAPLVAVIGAASGRTHG